MMSGTVRTAALLAMQHVRGLQQLATAAAEVVPLERAAFDEHLSHARTVDEVGDEVDEIPSSPVVTDLDDRG